MFMTLTSPLLPNFQSFFFPPHAGQHEKSSVIHCCVLPQTLRWGKLLYFLQTVSFSSILFFIYWVVCVPPCILIVPHICTIAHIQSVYLSTSHLQTLSLFNVHINQISVCMQSVYICTAFPHHYIVASHCCNACRLHIYEIGDQWTEKWVVWWS